MKKLLTSFGLILSLAFPAIASSLEPKQPTVRPYSAEAMGCMILLECTEGVEKLTVDSELLKDPDFDPFREELKRIITALDSVNVPVYVAPERYFTPRTVGLYKPNYNRFFVNEQLLKEAGVI